MVRAINADFPPTLFFQPSSYLVRADEHSSGARLRADAVIGLLHQRGFRIIGLLARGLVEMALGLVGDPVGATHWGVEVGGASKDRTS